MANELKVELLNIRGIKEAKIELPFGNGVYTLVGVNGCGKSTLMQALSVLIYPHHLKYLLHPDKSVLSKIKISVDKNDIEYNNANNSVNSRCYQRYKGLYEGSLFYGTRFKDSTIVEDMLES